MSWSYFIILFWSHLFCQQSPVYHTFLFIYRIKCWNALTMESTMDPWVTPQFLKSWNWSRTVLFLLNVWFSFSFKPWSVLLHPELLIIRYFWNSKVLHIFFCLLSYCIFSSGPTCFINNHTFLIAYLIKRCQSLIIEPKVDPWVTPLFPKSWNWCRIALFVLNVWLSLSFRPWECFYIQSC